MQKTVDIQRICEEINSVPTFLLSQLADAFEEQDNVVLTKGLRWMVEQGTWPWRNTASSWKFMSTINWDLEFRSNDSYPYRISPTFSNKEFNSCSEAVLALAKVIGEYLEKQ